MIAQVLLGIVEIGYFCLPTTKARIFYSHGDRLSGADGGVFANKADRGIDGAGPRGHSAGLLRRASAVQGIQLRELLLMKSIIRAGLLTLATVPALAVHADEQICNATFKTVVFDYRPPASDPFLQKLFDDTKAKTGSSPDEILAAYFGKDQYEVLSRNLIVVTADSQLNWSEGLDNDTPIAVRGKTGKIDVITSHTGWRYKYYAVPIEGSVRTALTVERFVATPVPIALTGKWVATAGQNHIETLGNFKNSYGFLTQLVGTDCH